MRSRILCVLAISAAFAVVLGADSAVAGYIVGDYIGAAHGTGQPVSDGVWTKLTVEQVNGVSTFYINDVAQTGTSSIPLNQTTGSYSFALGRTPDIAQGYGWYGILDELEVDGNITQTPTVVAQYHMGGGPDGSWGTEFGGSWLGANTDPLSSGHGPPLDTSGAHDFKYTGSNGINTPLGPWEWGYSMVGGAPGSVSGLIVNHSGSGAGYAYDLNNNAARDLIPADNFRIQIWASGGATQGSLNDPRMLFMTNSGEGGIFIGQEGGNWVAGHIVPEPSALALVVSAAIGLLCYAWRRRK